VVRVLESPRTRLALLGVLLVAAGMVTAILGTPDPRQIERAIDDAGPAGPLAFILAYAILTLLLFPGALITAAGGALFGVVGGTVLSVIGASLGATGAFLVGRRLGRPQVERIAGRRMRALDGFAERNGFLAVLYVRLVPVFPFNVLNYAAGVTAVSRRDYVAGTVIGIIPGAFAYAALGGSIGEPTSPEFLGAAALTIVLAVGGTVVSRRRRDPVRRPEPS
jgi:uncharacterized membrane protein YdjX (TVP38/TMEM64 family)